MHRFSDGERDNIEYGVEDRYIDEGGNAADEGKCKKSLAPARTSMCYVIGDIKYLIDNGPFRWLVTW